MFVQHLAGRERDHCLTQRMFMASIHGVRATAARRVLDQTELLPHQCSQ